MVSKNTLTVTDIQILGEPIVFEARRAAHDWNSQHRCERSVTIMALKPNDSPQTISGIIKVSPEDTDVRSRVLTEMTIACKPDKITRVSSPIPVDLTAIIPGIKGNITAVQGLTVFIELTGSNRGSVTTFRLFERGVAVRDAAAFQGYLDDSERITRIRELTEKKFPQSQDLQGLIIKSDLSGFVRGYKSLPANTPITTQDVQDVMEDYARSFNNMSSNISKSTN